MAAFLWAALGFLVLATIGGSVFVGVRTWQAWNAFVSLAAAAGAGAERLATAVEQLTARAEHVAGRSDELISAVERLERSAGRSRILLGALGDVRNFVGAIRGIVPSK
jgi:hypothetical protein